MEIVYQERDGEREMELWEDESRVCTLKDVTDPKRIERLVAWSAAVAAAATLAAGAATRERMERAAWNEGYFGVDAVAASEMADAGIGKTCEEAAR